MKNRLVKLVVVMAALTAVSIAILVFLAGSSYSRAPLPEVEAVETPRPKAEPRKSRFKNRESLKERWARLDAESEKRQAELMEQMEREEAERPKKKKRRVKRFRWESPAAERARVWVIPESESKDAVLTAFLRICIAEADGNLQDCVGIWQVMNNIRARTCRRGMVRRITECDENGETMLSVMRRSQRHIMGMIPLRNRRAAWIRNMTTDCENPPEGWTRSENLWDSRYGSKRCPQVVALGRALIAGEKLPQAPGQRLRWLPGRPITWGGRCESNTASCDDRMACARGLTRVKGGPKTSNAFWRRPLTKEEVEPVCVQLGYGELYGDAIRRRYQHKQPPPEPVSEEERADEAKGG